MAPKGRGGGGGVSYGGGSSDVHCYSPFNADYVYSYLGWTLIAYFVCYCLFFVFYLILYIVLCCVRRRLSVKRLVGPIYMVSITFVLFSLALLIIGTMLRECKTTPYFSFYNYSLAANLLANLANYLLLVVVAWGVNILLRERLNSGRSVYKGIVLVVLVVMGCLTASLVGLQSYNTWLVTEEGQRSDMPSRSDDAYRLSLAYWILYMLSALASGVLAIVSLVSMRHHSMPVGSLLGWVIALTFCMFVWTLIMVLEYAAMQPNNYNNFIGTEGFVACDYLINFFQLFSYICILFLAKSPRWNTPAAPAAPAMVLAPNGYQNGPQYGPAPVPQQQYAYNGQPGQQYYYQQQPVYSGQVPANGTGHLVEVK